VDDAFLQRATATIPKRSIVLVEDIDCALPSREEDDDSDAGSPVRRDRPRQSGVTLSGLLNMIDGIGSEEGKLFFATVCLFIPFPASSSSSSPSGPCKLHPSLIMPLTFVCFYLCRRTISTVLTPR
jgi:hypothetical protein